MYSPVEAKTYGLKGYLLLKIRTFRTAVLARVHFLQFDIQIRKFKSFKRFELCMSQEIYSHSKKISE